MDLLAKKICERLLTHKSCTIFASDLDRLWPLSIKELNLREQRNALTKAFAKAHGWSVKIHDPGIRVVFRKLKPAEEDKDSPKLAKAS